MKPRDLIELMQRCDPDADVIAEPSRRPREGERTNSVIAVEEFSDPKNGRRRVAIQYTSFENPYGNRK